MELVPAGAGRDFLIPIFADRARGAAEDRRGRNPRPERDDQYSQCVGIAADLRNGVQQREVRPLADVDSQNAHRGPRPDREPRSGQVAHRPADCVREEREHEREHPRGVRHAMRPSALGEVRDHRPGHQGGGARPQDRARDAGGPGGLAAPRRQTDEDCDPSPVHRGRHRGPEAGRGHHGLREVGPDVRRARRLRDEGGRYRVPGSGAGDHGRQVRATTRRRLRRSVVQRQDQQQSEAQRRHRDPTRRNAEGNVMGQQPQLAPDVQRPADRTHRRRGDHPDHEAHGDGGQPGRDGGQRGVTGRTRGHAETASPWRIPEEDERLAGLQNQVPEHGGQGRRRWP